jgi:DNA-binding CsgD family transcriptional regulator/PAS domain-containing protein
MSGDEKLLMLVDRIYESVDHPELWPETMRAIDQMIGGKSILWASDDRPETLGRVPLSSCHSTLFLSQSDLRQLDEYEREFGELIVRFFKIILLSILGSPSNVGARESMILSMARRFLNRFERAEGQPDLSGPAATRSRMLAALWEGGHIFAPQTLRAMRLLVPHLDRAARLQMRMASASLRADLLSGALDALTLGVVLVDAAGLPLSVNRRAHEITHRSNALRLGAAGLVAASRSDNQSLRQLISDATSTGSQGLLAISRGLELRPLLLMAIPLKPEAKHEALTDSPCCAIFISDPDRIDNPSVEALRRAFDLTYREAQTAIAVANGHGLKAAAKSMGIALTTARSQLQQAFAKTGTRQQAELAALVHRTLAQLRYDRSAAEQTQVARALSRDRHNDLPHHVSLPSKR